MILLNGKPINITIFPDNTSQVWKLNQEILETTNFANITWKFEHEGEFMHLAQLKMLLDKYGFKTRLKLPYLPYGRQDKPVSNNFTFALNSFCSLLSSLRFDEIAVIDPHSELFKIMVPGVKNIYPIDTVTNIIEETQSSIICYPDLGALSKYKNMFDIDYMYGLKHRNQSTGIITAYDLDKIPTHMSTKSILIVDDICDGGSTFVLLAKALYNVGAKEVNLFVSHGIFSKGLKPLFDAGIKRIFTKDGEVSEHQQLITYRRL